MMCGLDNSSITNIRLRSLITISSGRKRIRMETRKADSTEAAEAEFFEEVELPGADTVTLGSASYTKMLGRIYSA
jgi:hypothetical protein